MFRGKLRLSEAKKEKVEKEINFIPKKGSFGVGGVRTATLSPGYVIRVSFDSLS
jgi:hypothetical protein